MTTTVYNSKDIKYIWSTSDDDCLTSMTFLCEDNIIYVITCAYDDDTTDMKYTYYKSTDTANNQELWNQLIIDNLENFDKYFKEVTDEKGIEYIENKKVVYNTFTNEACHNLSHDLLRSMIIALYTNIKNETFIDDIMLNRIYDDVIDMLGVNPAPLSADSLTYIREYAKDSLFEAPLLLYRETQYRNMVSGIIKLITDIYA